MTKQTKAAPTVTFRFLVHDCATGRECRMAIKVEDREDRSFVSMADEAEERAYKRGYRKFGRSADLEVISQ